MASQVRMANYQASNLAGQLTRHENSFRGTSVAAPELLGKTPSAVVESTGEALTPDFLAYGVEFVALPGKAAILQRAVPEALRDTLGNSRSFSGCIVLVSEQESRLVTVITLWTGRNRVEQCNENSKEVKRLLAPYVDHFLRTRRLAAFLSAR